MGMKKDRYVSPHERQKSKYFDGCRDEENL